MHRTESKTIQNPFGLPAQCRVNPGQTIADVSLYESSIAKVLSSITTIISVTLRYELPIETPGAGQALSLQRRQRSKDYFAHINDLGAFGFGANIDILPGQSRHRTDRPADRKKNRQNLRSSPVI